jgi:hypothetical protein
MVDLCPHQSVGIFVALCQACRVLVQWRTAVHVGHPSVFPCLVAAFCYTSQHRLIRLDRFGVTILRVSTSIALLTTIEYSAVATSLIDVV